MPMTPTRHVPQVSHWRSLPPGRYAVCLKGRWLLTPLARRSTMYSKHAGGAGRGGRLRHDLLLLLLLLLLLRTQPGSGRRLQLCVRQQWKPLNLLELHGCGRSAAEEAVGASRNSGRLSARAKGFSRSRGNDIRMAPNTCRIPLGEQILSLWS